MAANLGTTEWLDFLSGNPAAGAGAGSGSNDTSTNHQSGIAAGSGRSAESWERGERGSSTTSGDRPRGGGDDRPGSRAAIGKRERSEEGQSRGATGRKDGLRGGGGDILLKDGDVKMEGDT